MVLHHVAQHARTVVVAAARSDIDLFTDIKLDIVDEIFVPQRLEHAVRKTKGKQVLHGFLTEVMINAVDLVLIPVGENRLVQMPCRFQVGTKWLLYDDTFPTRPFLEACLMEIVAKHAEEAGRGRKIK